MKKRVLAGLIAFGAAAGILVPAWGQQGDAPKPTAAEPTSMMVLNTYGIWRFSSELAPPVIVDGTVGTMRHVWLNHRTPAVAPDWMAPDFNDQFWNRGPVTLAPRTAMLARACLRGKFEVTDVSAVKGLTLSVGYKGGLVVYVNGKEVKREHIEGGKGLADGPAGEERHLTGLAIPNSLLRRGVNVIGLEVVRVPYAQEPPEMAYKENTCQILNARLTAEGAAGLVPSATRPDGLQVWNADPLSADFQVDFGNPSEPLRPVVIVGARNGRFTGKVVVGSTKAIRGLKVTPGELKGQGGTIPGTSVEIRYGMPWGTYRQVSPSPYAASATRLGALAQKPLEVFEVLKPVQEGSRETFRPDAKEVSSPNGAVVPLWLTVKMPAGAGAGAYTGTVKVEVQGENPVMVPVEVHVADWTLPDTQDLHTFVDIIQCPDTSALEYDVPMWSERHWEMIGDAFKVIGQTGARTVYIPLIVHTNFGNEESMVRWIRKGEGKYDYDFRIMDRYLDVATKNMGRPEQVIFVVWDVYMMPVTDNPAQGRSKATAKNLESLGAEYGKGPRVTVLDPATQKTEIVELPTHFETEKSRALWKPLMDKLHERMRARGLEGAMMLGVQHDTWATKEEHVFFKEVSGDLPWVIHSHEGVRFNTLQYGISKVGYQNVVWMVTFSDDNAARPKGSRGGVQSHMGWARPDLVAQFDRGNGREHSPNTFWFRLAEAAITGSQRGNGRLGGDYWQVMKDKNGRRVGRTHNRYPESSWRNLFIPEALLAPGPEGPVASDQLEAYRLGIQECEARIVLEYGLDRKRAELGGELAKRCEDYLHRRHMEMWLTLGGLQLYPNRPGGLYLTAGWRGGTNIAGTAWYLGSGHQQSSEELFQLAGEVTRKIGPLPPDVSKKDGAWPIMVRN